MTGPEAEIVFGQRSAWRELGIAIGIVKDDGRVDEMLAPLDEKVSVLVT